MTAVLSLDRVSRRYGDRRVLSNVSFAVAANEVVGVIGPNGAGKTTMLRIAVGLLRADEGRVDVQVATGSHAARGRAVGYFAGESTIPPAVRERRWRGLFHDTERRASNRAVRTLSRGTRQLLGLRTLFALEGLHLIVLDEPWEGLDPDAARWLTAAIESRRDGGAAVLVSSHRLHDLAGVCGRYVFLDCGTTTCVNARDLENEGHVTGEALMAAFDLVRGVTR